MITSSGQQIAVDLRLQGNDSSGTITMGGVPVQVTVVNNVAYAKAPQQFWEQQGHLPATVAAQLSGKWVKLPADSASEFNSFNLTGLVDDFQSARASASATASDAPSGGTVTRGDLNGQPVVIVTDPDGAVVEVAATGKPYPLLIKKSGAESGKLTFSEFGQAQHIAAPPDALDLSQLAGGAAASPTGSS